MSLEILTVAEAAQKARVSRRHLNDQIREGNGPAVTKIGTATRIRVDVLDDWLCARTMQPTRASAEPVAA